MHIKKIEKKKTQVYVWEKFKLKGYYGICCIKSLVVMISRLRKIKQYKNSENELKIKVVSVKYTGFRAILGA